METVTQWYSVSVNFFPLCGRENLCNQPHRLSSLIQTVFLCKKNHVWQVKCFKQSVHSDTVTFVLVPFVLSVFPLFLFLQHAPLQSSTRSVQSRGPRAGPAGMEGGEDEGRAVGSLWGGSLLQRGLLPGAGAPWSTGSRPPHVDRWETEGSHWVETHLDDVMCIC